MIHGFDPLDPEKKYYHKGFDILPSLFWYDEFFKDLKSLFDELLYKGKIILCGPKRTHLVEAN